MLILRKESDNTVRMWTKSACVVLAWSILIILVAVGLKESARPAQANISIASSTTDITPASTLSVAAAPVRTAQPNARYAVQPGDTLSGIAARFAVRGGWPALYAANRQRIGPDPDIIRAGTVLTVPRPAAPPPPASRPGRRPSPAPPSAPPGSRPQPVRTRAPTATGMPQGLKTLLLAAGLAILAVFLAGLLLAVRRWRQQAAGWAVQPGNAGVRSPPDRDGRSRGVAAAVRPVAAAARVHPVGVAVPSAVLVTGIVLFTFVNSATTQAIPPPGGSGPGSVCAARPSTDQPHYRQPRPSGQPALPSSPEQETRSLTGSLEHMVPLLPVLAAGPPAGPGRAPQASRNPSSRLPGGLVCDVKQVPRPRLRRRPGARG